MIEWILGLEWVLPEASAGFRVAAIDPFTWVYIAISAISAGASYSAARKAKKAASKLGGALLNKMSTIDGIPVVYGERRVGGTIVFKSTKDAAGSDPNEYLYVLMVLCEGEIESITDIEIDGNPVTLPRYQVATVYRGTVYYGSDTQSADANWISEIPHLWTSNHRLRGLAYVAFRFRYNNDAYYGEPEMTALVKGRKVYDPRLDSTNGGSGAHRSNNPATWAWSDNPALCIRDYLTNTRFGKGLVDAEINDTYFRQAATDCDSFVTVYTAGPSVQIFRCNAVLSTDETIMDNLKDMLLGCKGFLPFIEGKYALLIDKSASSLFSVNSDHIIADADFAIMGAPKDKKFNRVICKFVNSENQWQEDQAVWPEAGSAEETTYLAEDGGTLLVQEFDLATITNYYAARDFARIICLRTRNQLRCSFVATSELMDLVPGDVIDITHSTPGWSAKPFQIEEMSLNYDGTVSLACIEYDTSIYTYDPANQEHTYTDTDLPDPFIVAPPTSFTITETTTLMPDGSIGPALLGEWVAADDSYVEYYEVQGKKSADSIWNSRFTTTTNYLGMGYEIGVQYDFRVRAFNAITSSEWATETFTLTGDTTVPAAPSAITATGSLGGIYLEWTNPADSDLAYIDIYESSTNNSGAAVKIGRVAAENFSRISLAGGTTKYYFLKSVDASGNESGFSAVSTATSTADPLDGARNAMVYYYYSTAQSATPTAPVGSEVTYDFSTGVASTTASGWSSTFNPAAVANTVSGENKYWAVRVTFQEDEFGGAVTKAISASFKWTNFDGLVTFTNLANAEDEDGNNITFIDGGSIVADTLTVNSIKSGTTKNYGDFIFELGTSTVVAGYTGAGLFRTASATGFAIGGLASVAGAYAVAGQSSAQSATSYGGAFVSSIATGSTNHRSMALLANLNRGGYFDAGTFAQNGLLYSEDFSNANWTKTRSTVTTNTTAAPDGTTTADSVLQATGQTTVGFVSQSYSVSSLESYEVSVYAKPATRSFLAIEETLADGTTNRTWFNVSAGTVGTTDAAHYTATITAAANGFYRCVIQFDADAARSGVVAFLVAESNGSTTCTDDTLGLYLWGAQINLVAYDDTYIKTEGSVAAYQKVIANIAYAANLTYALQTIGNVYFDGDVTYTGSVNPFTGSHDGLIDANIVPEIGDILVDTGVAVKKDVSNVLTYVDVSQAAGIPAIGVFAGKRQKTYVPVCVASSNENTGEYDETFVPTILPEYENLFEGKDIAIVNSLGEGQVNVCGENGNIAAGDLIITSSTPGKGMRQSDDIVRSKTVAKAREAVTFSDPGEVAQIACIYLCG